MVGECGFTAVAAFGLVVDSGGDGGRGIDA